jgi:hypothetical protein
MSLGKKVLPWEKLGLGEIQDYSLFLKRKKGVKIIFPFVFTEDLLFLSWKKKVHNIVFVLYYGKHSVSVGRENLVKNHLIELFDKK